MKMWEIFELEDLISKIENIQNSLSAARNSVKRGDIHNALYIVDHTDLDLASIRNKLVSLIHHKGTSA